MNTMEFKNITEAAAELTRKTSHNMTDIGIRTWKDIVAFNDVVAKAQADVIKGYAPGHGYQEIAEMVSKVQTDTIKAFTGWMNGFNQTK